MIPPPSEGLLEGDHMAHVSFRTKKAAQAATKYLQQYLETAPSPNNQIEYELTGPRRANPTLWVGNIRDFMTQPPWYQSFLGLFTRYGAVSRVKLMPERSCAFVEYHTAEDANVARNSLHGVTFGSGRYEHGGSLRIQSSSLCGSRPGTYLNVDFSAGGADVALIRPTHRQRRSRPTSCRICTSSHPSSGDAHYHPTVSSPVASSRAPVPSILPTLLPLDLAEDHGQSAAASSPPRCPDATRPADEGGTTAVVRQRGSKEGRGVSTTRRRRGYHADSGAEDDPASKDGPSLGRQGTKRYRKSRSSSWSLSSSSPGGVSQTSGRPSGKTRGLSGDRLICHGGPRRGNDTDDAHGSTTRPYRHRGSPPRLYDRPQRRNRFPSDSPSAWWKRVWRPPHRHGDHQQYHSMDRPNRRLYWGRCPQDESHKGQPRFQLSSLSPPCSTSRRRPPRDARTLSQDQHHRMSQRPAPPDDDAGGGGFVSEDPRRSTSSERKRPRGTTSGSRESPISVETPQQCLLVPVDQASTTSSPTESQSDGTAGGGESVEGKDGPRTKKRGPALDQDEETQPKRHRTSVMMAGSATDPLVATVHPGGDPPSTLRPVESSSDDVQNARATSQCHSSSPSIAMKKGDDPACMMMQPASSSIWEDENAQPQQHFGTCQLLKQGQRVCQIRFSLERGNAHQTPPPVIDVVTRTTEDKLRTRLTRRPDSFTIWKLSPDSAADTGAYNSLWDYFKSRRRIGLLETHTMTLFIVPLDRGDDHPNATLATVCPSSQKKHIPSS